MTTLKFYLRLNASQNVYAIIEESKHPLTFIDGCYYEGFGTPDNNWHKCIEPMQFGNGFLQEKCREIMRDEVHLYQPEMLEYIDIRLGKSAFYTRLYAKDVTVGMKVKVGQGFYEVIDIFPSEETMMVRTVNSSGYPNSNLDIFPNEKRIMREYPTK